MSEIGPSLRVAVELRARLRCEYCHLPMKGQIATFPVDHILPRIFGGVTELSNLALACPQCNAHKWKHTTGVDPESHQEIPLFNPRVDEWSEHFEWKLDPSWILIGKSPRGRATIERLQMNQPDIVVTRSLLARLGLICSLSMR